MNNNLKIKMVIALVLIVLNIFAWSDLKLSVNEPIEPLIEHYVYVKQEPYVTMEVEKVAIKEVVVKDIYVEKLMLESLNLNYVLSEETDNPMKIDMNSISGVTAKQIDDYLVGTPLYGIGSYCILAEKEYGVNAVGLMAMAIQESGWGRNPIRENNILSISAYDIDPKGNAKDYDSFGHCLMDGARLLKENYLSENGKYYGGSPTLNGINQKYASDKYEEADPLSWADKVGSIMGHFKNEIISEVASIGN